MTALYFDLIDRCQLACPSCYHGLYGGGGQIMTLGTCRSILDHCVAHLGVRLVGPFNWGEPLLYPRLREFLDLVAGYPDLVVCLSSNLNAEVTPSLAEALVRQVDVLLFSVSGLEQEVYARYHRGGDIDIVLANIARLVEARDTAQSSISMQWVLGRTRYNSSQIEPIARYCRGKGILLQPTRYYVTSIEDVHRILLGQPVPERAWEALYASLEEVVQDIRKRLTPGYCPLLHDVVVDCEGRLMTCCGGKIVLDTPVTAVHSPDELVRAKQANPFCRRCLALGLGGYFLGGSF